MRPQVTFRPAPAHPARGHLVVFAPDGEDAGGCGALVEALGLRGAVPAEVDVAVPRGGAVGVAPRPALLVPLAVGGDARALHRTLAALLAAAGDRSLPASAQVWGVATRLALAAAAGHHLLPALHLGDAPEQRTTGCWSVDLDAAPDLASALDRLAESAPPAATALAVGPDRVADPRGLLGAFLDAAVDALVRTHAPPPSGRPRERLLPWTTRWAEALGDPDDPLVPLREEGPDLAAAVEGWRSRPEGDVALVLELVAPDAPTGPWRLDLAAQDAEGVVHPAGEVWADPARGLVDGLLAALSRAARVFPPLDAALAQESPTALPLTLDGAWHLIAEAAPLLAGAGVVVRLPSTLAEDGLAARIRLASAEDGTVEASWEVALDDRLLDDDEVDDLAGRAAAGDALGFFGGRWVKVDDEARAALRSRGRRRTMSRAEGVALALAGSTGADWFGEGTAAGRVVVDDALARLVEAIRAAGDLEEVPEAPEGFTGELRPYQRRGVAWLRGMADLGVGAVLADAMGLGKTIQLIGLLVSRPGPFAVVCPTSVVGNWEREIRRFAPGLEVVRHHGPERSQDPGDLDGFTGVLVTSYGTLRRDVELLGAVRWDVVALDEAQHVKNPTTAAAKAIRRLKAGTVVALTGTPLENRLADLWAVVDATNRGLLGSRTAFSRRFVAPVEVRRDAAAADRLRRLVAPFVLRRAKDDPEVAGDLPDKIERDVICGLTPEQAALYDQVVERSLADIGASGGIDRRGRVLALLTALKQVVNHPAQYLKQPGPVAGRSGKLAALQEIVGAVADAGDAMLVFTQFTRMGDLLVTQLSQDLGQPIPFLHGGLSLGRRDAMVEDFQQGGAPVLVISTRAGGTGLNLTAATHVVHYDRWWNPAVEDQATDRVHRIGQTRAVEVHKLITAGTLEERIAELLERKRALADAVVGAGETWLAELDDAALADLVRLSRDAPVADPLGDDDLVGAVS
jgi:superfamily II DNA or RNA helicase